MGSAVADSDSLYEIYDEVVGDLEDIENQMMEEGPELRDEEDAIVPQTTLDGGSNDAWYAGITVTGACQPS